LEKKAENLVAAVAARIFVKNGGGMCSKLVTTQIGNNLNPFFCSTLSEFENFLLCERILINVTTCQNETSS
jgi:hypothetical protein